MTQDEILDMAMKEAEFVSHGKPSDEESELFVCTDKDIVRFAHLVAAKSTEEANAKANASWTLMCEKMVAIEREACEHDIEVLMNALWKACGDDAEVVNATIESQGELTRARGEQT